MSSQSADERRAWLDGIPRDEQAALEHWWPFWARPAQLPPPGTWRTWLILAGSTSAGGCMHVYRDMVKFGMVDAIVATGASIVDMDFFEALQPEDMRRNAVILASFAMMAANHTGFLPRQKRGG